MPYLIRTRDLNDETIVYGEWIINASADRMFRDKNNAFGFEIEEELNNKKFSQIHARFSRGYYNMMKRKRFILKKHAEVIFDKAFETLTDFYMKTLTLFETDVKDVLVEVQKFKKFGEKKVLQVTDAFEFKGDAFRLDKKEYKNAKGKKLEDFKLLEKYNVVDMNSDCSNKVIYMLENRKAYVVIEETKTGITIEKVFIPFEYSVGADLEKDIANINELYLDCCRCLIDFLFDKDSSYFEGVDMYKF